MGRAVLVLTALSVGVLIVLFPLMAIVALLIKLTSPGPVLFEQQPEIAWGVIASMMVGNIALLVINLPLAIPLVQLLKIPQRIMLPLVLGMGYMGAYFLNYSSFDFVLVSISALGGYMASKLSIPIPPLVLALILGGMTEQSFRNSLQISNGSYGIFVEKPIALTFLIMAAASLIYALMKHKKSA